jgi:hypothetical protein
MSLSLNRKIDPGELRHGNIANQEIGRARLDVFQSFQGVGKKASCVAAALQNQCKRLRDDDLIIYDKNDGDLFLS